MGWGWQEEEGWSGKQVGRKDQRKRGGGGKDERERGGEEGGRGIDERERERERERREEIKGELGEGTGHKRSTVLKSTACCSTLAFKVIWQSGYEVSPYGPPEKCPEVRAQLHVYTITRHSGH